MVFVNPSELPQVVGPASEEFLAREVGGGGEVNVYLRRRRCNGGGIRVLNGVGVGAARVLEEVGMGVVRWRKGEIRWIGGGGGGCRW